MIAYVLLAREPLTCTTDELYARFGVLSATSGSEPEIVVVSTPECLPKDSLNAGRFVREDAFTFVPLRNYRSWPLALRGGLSRAPGAHVYFFDKLADVTKDVYDALIPGAMFPARSAGSTFAREPWTVKPSPKGGCGLKLYTGPLAFPFALRRAAMQETGLLPPTTGESVEAMLAAFTMQLRGAGWWITGARVA